MSERDDLLRELAEAHRASKARERLLIDKVKQAERERDEARDLLSLYESTDSEALAVLRELVTLKDGPRDADYERRKPLAWQAARDLLNGAA